MKFTNPVIGECSHCHQQLHQRLTGNEAVLNLLVFAGLMVLFTSGMHLSFATAVLFGVIVSFPFNTATERLYQTYWLWKHPDHCHHA